MRNTSMTIIIPALFAIAILGSGPADAKPVRTTTISGQSAEAFCHGHGGGNNCIFCHRDHCHVISCDKGSGGKTFCTNTVSFRKAGRGGGRGPVAGLKPPGRNAPPNGYHHPVKVTGFGPPSGVKTMGGDSGPVIGRVEMHHFGGGHR